MLWSSLVRSLYFRIFSNSFLITFLSPETATSINVRVPFIPLHYRGLWCPVYWWRWLWRFALFDGVIWLPYLHDLLLLILVQADSSFLCLIVHLFPCICKSVSRVSVYSPFPSIDCADILFSVVLSCFRFVMCLLHDIWFVMPVIPPPSSVALGPDSGSWPFLNGLYDHVYWTNHTR